MAMAWHTTYPIVSNSHWANASRMQRQHPYNKASFGVFHSIRCDAVLLQLTEWMIEWANERTRDWITQRNICILCIERMSVFWYCLMGHIHWNELNSVAAAARRRSGTTMNGVYDRSLAHAQHTYNWKGAVLLIRYQREVIGVWMRVELCVLFVRVYYINDTAATAAAEHWEAEQRNGDAMQWWETNLSTQLCIECVWK